MLSNTELHEIGEHSNDVSPTQTIPRHRSTRRIQWIHTCFLSFVIIIILEGINIGIASKCNSGLYPYDYIQPNNIKFDPKNISELRALPDSQMENNRMNVLCTERKEYPLK